MPAATRKKAGKAALVQRGEASVQQHSSCRSSRHLRGEMASSMRTLISDCDASQQLRWPVVYDRVWRPIARRTCLQALPASAVPLLYLPSFRIVQIKIPVLPCHSFGRQVEHIQIFHSALVWNAGEALISRTSLESSCSPDSARTANRPWLDVRPVWLDAPPKGR